MSAAADLVSQRGYHAVGMADIGAQAGIVGSGVYRHFDSKAAVLATLLDQLADTLARNAASISARAGSAGQALSSLIRDHIEVAVEDRRLLQVYLREIQNLPEADRIKLADKQQHYIEQWVRALATMRPDLSEAAVHLAVHAVIGAIQSVAFVTTTLPRDKVVGLLDTIAHAALGVTSDPRVLVMAGELTPAAT